MAFKKSFSDFDRFFSNFHFRWTITNKKRREDDDDFFIIMLALFSFRLFPLESFLHFKGKIMVIIIIIILAVVCSFLLDTVVCSSFFLVIIFFFRQWMGLWPNSFGCHTLQEKRSFFWIYSAFSCSSYFSSSSSFINSADD